MMRRYAHIMVIKKKIIMLFIFSLFSCLTASFACIGIKSAFKKSSGKDKIALGLA